MSKHLAALFDNPASQTVNSNSPASSNRTTVPTSTWFERVSIAYTAAFSFNPAEAARPRGPLKYSWIHG